MPRPLRADAPATRPKVPVPALPPKSSAARYLERLAEQRRERLVSSWLRSLRKP